MSGQGALAGWHYPDACPVLVPVPSQDSSVLAGRNGQVWGWLVAAWPRCLCFLMGRSQRAAPRARGSGLD